MISAPLATRPLRTQPPQARDTENARRAELIEKAPRAEFIEKAPRAELIEKPARNELFEKACHPELVEGPPQSPTLEERIDASVDAALAEALAKVKTPADDELAKQQQAFDRMMQLRTEREREANAIREFGLAQQKKENDFLNEYIRMI